MLFLQIFLCQFALSLPQFQIEEFEKYGDTLSPPDYQEVLEKARQMQLRLDSCKSAGTGEPDLSSEIKALKDYAEEKLKQRKFELEGEKSLLQDEFARLNMSFNKNLKEFSPEQKRGFEKTIATLKSRLNALLLPSKALNQALDESSVLLAEMRDFDRKLNEFALDRARIEGPGAGPSLSPAKNRFIGNPGFIGKSGFIGKPGFIGSKSYMHMAFPSGAPNSGQFSYSASSEWRPAEQAALPKEADYGLQLFTLRSRLDALSKIKAIGTFESESMAKEISELAGFLGNSKESVRPLGYREKPY
ncbi:MAG: hypothetical protein K2X27_07990, partial [Candidatus Obscuribacterales bacterium]|nr:hypothetical protein [Candidatus Obscuribacterales bacterium]